MPSLTFPFGPKFANKRYRHPTGRAGGTPKVHCSTCRCPVALEGAREVVLRLLTAAKDVWYTNDGIAKILAVERTVINNVLCGLVRSGEAERVKVGDGFTRSFAYRLARKGTK
jgi:hypothetical protein